MATAAAIRAHEAFFRLGFAAEMMTNVLAIPVTLIMYRLLAPTGRFMALLGIALDLTQNTVNAVNAWTQFAPMTLLGGSPELAAIPPHELSRPGSPRAALARRRLRHWPDLLRLRPADRGRPDLPVRLFSALARRALRSGRRLLGLINSYATFMAPSLPIFPYILFPCLIGEGAVCLWLIVVGGRCAKMARSGTPQRAVGVRDLERGLTLEG